MNSLRLKSILIAISMGLVCVQSEASLKADCQAFLSQAVARTQVILKPILHPVHETPAADTSDYQPTAYQDLSLSDRFIHTYNRIQSRHHKSNKTMFFYDYEVHDVIVKMKATLLDARDFSAPQTADERAHRKLLKRLQQEISQYDSVKKISYDEFHETTLNFSAFIKKGLKSSGGYKVNLQGRYSQQGYIFTSEMIKSRQKTSGIFDVDHELSWVIERSRLLRRGPRAIFIPTFEDLNEDFFNGISSYPVFPAGLTTNPNIIVDGQLFGSVLFLLHDFYHAEKSLRSIVYTPAAIAARELRRKEFNTAVAKVEDSDLNRMIRVLFHYITHEQKALPLKKGSIVLSQSKHVVKALNIDGEFFEEIQMRLYARPYDFGELFGDQVPGQQTLFGARQWVADFFRKDMYYP